MATRTSTAVAAPARYCEKGGVVRTVKVAVLGRARAR